MLKILKNLKNLLFMSMICRKNYTMYKMKTTDYRKMACFQSNIKFELVRNEKERRTYRRVLCVGGGGVRIRRRRQLLCSDGHLAGRSCSRCAWIPRVRWIRCRRSRSRSRMRGRRCAPSRGTARTILHRVPASWPATSVPLQSMPASATTTAATTTTTSAAAAATRWTYTDATTRSATATTAASTASTAATTGATGISIVSTYIRRSRTVCTLKRNKQVDLIIFIERFYLLIYLCLIMRYKKKQLLDLQYIWLLNIHY